MTWATRLSVAAQNDFAEIIDWTVGQFGARQGRTYAKVLIAAIRELDGGPALQGARERPEIGRGIYTLHFARRGRKGRHFILFRIASGPELVLEILRVLHDAMDLPRHVPRAE